MLRKSLAIAIALTLVLATTSAELLAAATEIVYPNVESAQDQRATYPLQVLALALDKSGQSYRLRASDEHMQQARSVRELMAGRLTVMWTVASRERDQQLRRIPFPIDKGLIGVRELLIRQDDQARFATVQSLATLAAFVAGQGHDWPDLAILRANGLTVADNPTYAGLFAMLARQRIDYLPRGASEVVSELDTYQKEGFVIEPRLLLIYPEALFFYVNRNDSALADAIALGLQRSEADGSFAALFQATYGAAVDDIAKHALPLHLRIPDALQQVDDQHPELWLPINPPNSP